MDEAKRRKEREAQTGGIEERALHLRSQLRSGELTRKQLEIAGSLGDEASQLALNTSEAERQSPEKLEDFMKGLQPAKSRELMVRLGREVLLNALAQNPRSRALRQHRADLKAVIDLVDSWLLADSHPQRQEILNEQWLSEPLVGFRRSSTNLASAVRELFEALNPTSSHSDYGALNIQRSIAHSTSYASKGARFSDASAMRLVNESRQPVIEWALGMRDQVAELRAPAPESPNEQAADTSSAVIRQQKIDEQRKRIEDLFGGV